MPNHQYDDDFDDLNVNRAHTDENASAIGVVGFIFAMVSIGLLGVVAFLWYFMAEDQARVENVDQKRWMLYWFLFLDVISFFASLIAVLLGARGVTPTNPVYRGWSLTALILGVVEVVVTIFFGIFMTCFVLIFSLR